MPITDMDGCRRTHALNAKMCELRGMNHQWVGITGWDRMNVVPLTHGSQYPLCLGISSTTVVTERNIAKD